MTLSLSDLQQQRSSLHSRLAGLGDFRSGSITGTGGCCGNPRCHCHQANDPGHGPYYRLTRKVEGKTVTETFSTDAALRRHSVRSRNTIAFGDWARSCWKRTNSSAACGRFWRKSPPQRKKNGGSDPPRDHARSRAPLTGHFPGPAPDWAPRSGSDRDGPALGSTPGGGGRIEP